jgi:hypothetical protein
MNCAPRAGSSGVSTLTTAHVTDSAGSLLMARVHKMLQGTLAQNPHVTLRPDARIPCVSRVKRISESSQTPILVGHHIGKTGETANLAKVDLL